MRNLILYELQKNFPLVERPFETMAKSLNIDENEVIDTVKKAKEEGIIRQISAIYDTKRLGYESSLVAFEVDKADINGAVEILNSHPGISHNYERDHRFNIWFTIALPPDSRFKLQKSVELLAELSKAKEFIILPTLKLFKIMVKMDTTGKASKKESLKKREYKDMKLSSLHKEIIKYTQEDLKISKEPFKESIEKIGLDYDRFFSILNELKSAGVMRRYAAILAHRKAGFKANAMVVWDIDEKKADEIGEKVASFSAVSHCYLRPKFDNWPYNLFSMIHAKTKDEIDEIVKEIKSEIEYEDNLYLYSTREFKKVRVKYFTNDIEKWEERYL